MTILWPVMSAQGMRGKVAVFFCTKIHRLSQFNSVFIDQTRNNPFKLSPIVFPKHINGFLGELI